MTISRINPDAAQRDGHDERAITPVDARPVLAPSPASRWDSDLARPGDVARPWWPPARVPPPPPPPRWNSARPRPGAAPRRSRLLDSLPAIFAEDPFAARFVRIFEDMLDPIEQLVENLPYYFDPPTAPP